MACSEILQQFYTAHVKNASVMVLYRHLFQENERKATKTSFMVTNSLVKALSGYLLNGRRHVSAKHE
jgi:hypothetical protein